MNVTSELDGHSVTLTPHGDIEHEHLEELRDCVRRLPPAVTTLRWDLHAVPFLTIAGLHLLDASTTRLKVTFINLPSQPKRLLGLAIEMFPHQGWEQHLPCSPQSRAA